MDIIVSPSEFLKIKALHKAKSKKGLIAVKKQVTKKGKTFTQTFYVKPNSSTLKKPSKPAIVKESSQNKYSKPHWNTSEGFFMRTVNKLIKVPDKYVKDVFTTQGHTYVICRGLSLDSSSSSGYKVIPEYVAVEITTGLSTLTVFDGAKTVQSAKDKLKEKFKLYNKDIFDSALKEGKVKFDDIYSSGEVIRDTDGMYEEFDIKSFTSDTVDKYGEFLYKEFESQFTEEDSGGAVNAISIFGLQDWLHDNVNGDEARFSALDKQIKTTGSMVGYYLRIAVDYDISLKDAKKLVDVSNDIKDALEQKGTTEVSNRDIMHFVSIYRLYETTNFSDYNVYYDSTSPKVGQMYDTGIGVLATAIINKTNPKGGLNIAVADMMHSLHHGEDKLKYFKTTDNYGKEWNIDDLYYLGSWVVGGKVRNFRNNAKLIYNTRREDTDSEDMYSGSFLEVMEKQAVELNEVVYRGTANEKWLKAEPGMVVPMGIASFTRSLHITSKFGGDVVLIMGKPDHTITDLNTTEPISFVGVDVDSLITNSNVSSYTMKKTGVSSYKDEKEVIAIAPSVEIIKRKGKYVWIRPVEQNLIKMMKSIFENKSELIAELERTFDQPMREDIPELWF